MSKKNKKGQQQGQNQQEQQQPAPPPRSVKKESKGPVIYCYKSWNGNECAITFSITDEKGEPIKDGALRIFGNGIAPVSLLIANGSAMYQITVGKTLTIGIALLGTPASTWVKLFSPINEQEIVSQMSASRFWIP